MKDIGQLIYRRMESQIRQRMFNVVADHAQAYIYHTIWLDKIRQVRTVGQFTIQIGHGI